ncbi:hypothetical protein [Lentibacter sp. XHP0401]|jgi:hypothetical protein|uniref:hypothetical protein n=1 Tax=Lentibacter sp. XHP0401 TaxID=2984334 RepID=UPI0021E8184E|nr:hypothetical protein [Lentibacter sp. XHP0401]MCV2891796.1 hypothetical protein [Lentibacter sp. XHP0401]
MKRIFAIMTFVAAVFFAVSPFMTSGFNGFEASQFPVPQENPPIQPAGYAFSIWGLIYIWLILGTGFGLFSRADDGTWEDGRPALFVSLAVGASWIAVAQLSVIWATALIWVMLIGALAALARSGSTDRWWQREPIGAYAGWLTAASSVSIGLLLAGYGYTSQTTAAFIGLAIALAIAVAMQKARPDTLAYPLAVIWALVGVIISNFEPVNTSVIGLASVGIAYLTLATLKHRRS